MANPIVIVRPVVRRVVVQAPGPQGRPGRDSAVTSVASRTGDIVLGKGDVGLGNVDNTSDASKPVSTAQAAANASVAAAAAADATAKANAALASANAAAPGLAPVQSVAGRNGAVVLTLADLTDSTPAGRALAAAIDATAQRALLALGNSATRNVGTTAGTVAAGDDARLSDARTPTTHTHTASQISDSTTAGRTILTAADAAAQRTALGLGSAAGQPDTEFLRFGSVQSPSTAQVITALRNLKRHIVSLLLKKGPITATISTVARAGNVATVTTTVAHGMIVGQKVSVNATTDNTFDATDVAVIAVPSTTSFTYASTGSDKAATADTGSLTTWEVVTDSGHAPWGGPRIQSISGSTITITFDTPPAGAVVAGGTTGNHSNSYGGRIVPHIGAIGTVTVSCQFRQREMLHGRVQFSGTLTGGGATANANWTKEGDTTVSFFTGSGLNVLYIGHANNKLTTTGSRGASSWVPPMLNGPAGVRVTLPNYGASPFTASAYQPAELGFYCQLVNPTTGVIMDQAAVEALTPASTAQVVWSRNVDALIQDITAMPYGVTCWLRVEFLLP